MSIQLAPTMPRFLEEDRRPTKTVVQPKIPAVTTVQADLAECKLSAPATGDQDINFGVRHLIRAWCSLLVLSFSSSDEEYHEICGYKYGDPTKK